MSKARLSATSQSHVIVVQPIEGVVSMMVPALYLNVDGTPKLLNSLIDYYFQYPNKSLSWKRSVARSVGLFYDYCQAVKKSNVRIRSKNIHKHLVRQFAIGLAKGTLDTKTHEDRLGLFWPASSIKNSKSLISSLTQFIHWCDSEGIVRNDAFQNKSVLPSCEESTLSYLYQGMKAKAFMFLTHTVTTSQVVSSIALRKSQEIVDLGSSTNSTSDIKAFPPEFISPLLEYGFVINEHSEVPGDREDVTAKMITILLLFGGLRVSEPFHLWFNDVIPQTDGSCKVFLRHPSDAKTHLVGDENTSRSTYLAERRYLPRNDISATKSYKAGWKSLKVDQTLSAPVFFIHSAAEALFREMYIYYLRYRENLIRIHVSSGQQNHPFLFVKKGGDDIGAPYSISAYEGALKRAYKRVEKKTGMEIKWGKYYGTSPHGGRHRYAQLLKDCGVSPKVIQNCLRHRSILSQGIYTEPTYKDVVNAINVAKAKIEMGDSDLLDVSIVERLEDSYEYNC